MEKQKRFEAEMVLARDMVQKEGINFTTFKSRVSALLTNPKVISEDEWVDFYNMYAQGRWRMNHNYKEPPEEWAEDHFSVWTQEELDCELRSRKTKKK